MIVFPAIDLKAGQVVRLAEGDMARATVYGDDPAAQAMLFAEAGSQYLHVVDLDGSFAGRAENREAVEVLHDARLPLFAVGHSFGGHAFGLLPNHHKVAGFYTFGTGAGWHGWMLAGERLRVLAMWNLVGPLVVRAKGYLAWKRLGMGEDLPLGVYRDWKHWCRYPRYFFDDPQMAHLSERFAGVRTPIVAANATDDLWAMPRSRDAFMAAYSQAPYQALDLQPGRDGPRRIGHMGYFRADAQSLWEQALDWFDATAGRRAA